MSADITCPHCGKVLRGAGGSVGGGAFFHAADCPGPAVAQAKEGSPMLMDPEAASVLEQNALLRAALATSQADVTRVAAELAESVRALAVSQGEVAEEKHARERLSVALASASDSMVTLDNALNAKHAKLVEVADKLRALRGDLERARELLADVDWARGSGESFEEIVSGACLWCGEESPCPARVAIVTADTLRPHAEDCAYAAWYRDTFLAEAAPPTPAASPEPDRASPEVTVKEPRP